MNELEKIGVSFHGPCPQKVHYHYPNEVEEHNPSRKVLDQQYHHNGVQGKKHMSKP